MLDYRLIAGTGARTDEPGMGTGDRGQETGDGSMGREAATSDQRPATSDRRPATGDRRPATGDRRTVPPVSRCQLGRALRQQSRAATAWPAVDATGDRPPAIGPPIAGERSWTGEEPRSVTRVAQLAQWNAARTGARSTLALLHLPRPPFHLLDARGLRLAIRRGRPLRWWRVPIPLRRARAIQGLPSSLLPLALDYVDRDRDLDLDFAVGDHARLAREPRPDDLRHAPQVMDLFGQQGAETLHAPQHRDAAQPAGRARSARGADRDSGPLKAVEQTRSGLGDDDGR